MELSRGVLLVLALSASVLTGACASTGGSDGTSERNVLTQSQEG